MKTNLYFFIVFFGISINSFSQEIEWQNTIAGNTNDDLQSIQQTSDGGYILGGYSDSDISSDKTENCIGNYDYWIVKTDASGTIQWQNTIGGNSYDELYCIQETTDGGFILAGSSSSNIWGDKTETCIGVWDYWIVKTDALGNIQWQNTIGGNDYDVLNSIKQTTDGGYILGGYSRSGISGDKTEINIGGLDYWIVKTDAGGNIQWQNTIGGNFSDLLNSVQQTSDGGYILGGYSESNISGDKTENSNGIWDYWIIKTDATGNIQWQNTIGGIDTDELYSIQQTSDGGYILGGYSYSFISGDKMENCIGGSDYWLVKTDASGNIQWQNTIGGSGYDYLYSIQQTSDGGYILGGHSGSNISGDKTENRNGSYNYWIVKTDATGNIQWQNTIGGSGADLLYGIKQISGGGYILGGWSNSNNSGDKSENCNGYEDYWIVKITENCNYISGKLFIDANSNAVQDAGEQAAANKQITEINTGRFGFSGQNGNYSFSVLDSGNFAVVSYLNYHNVVPVSHNIYFSGIQQTDSLNDFAFQPTGVFNDLCVKITPLGNFRAGFNASYMVHYENVGTITLSPTVIFFPDNDVTFVSANPVANSVTTDSIVWNFGPLAPFQTGSILVTVNVNLGTPIGTLINSGAQIEPVAGDANTACNYSYWEAFVTGAVDPNAILVDRDTVLTTELTNPPYLDYIIWFQNTGNDTAFNARVLNNIPQELDVNSFEFVTSSHPMNITYGAHARLMTFTFDNILLPDSNVNEPASHGFVRYRIKPNTTLVAGDSIENTAFIYFDFNQPVQTDTAVTEIVLPTELEEASGGSGSKQLIVFPNPAEQFITISSSVMANDECQMTIYDLFGRKVYQSEIKHPEKNGTGQNHTSIDISAFAKGVYFMEVSSSPSVDGRSGGALRAKFVKQ